MGSLHWLIWVYNEHLMLPDPETAMLSYVKAGLLQITFEAFIQSNIEWTNKWMKLENESVEQPNHQSVQKCVNQAIH